MSMIDLHAELAARDELIAQLQRRLAVAEASSCAGRLLSEQQQQ